MNVLITGASSLLGWAVLRHAPASWRITACVHSNPDLPGEVRPERVVTLDISDARQTAEVVAAVSPDVVIHMASQGNLDYCESHPADATRINVGGTRNLLEASARFQPAFLFLSTIYVFDGAHPPYEETAIPCPVNHYAVTKLEAEQQVMALNARAAILRPMTLYGWHSPRQRANWVTWLLDRMARGETTPVVDDVISNQIWVGDAAAAVIEAVQRRATGIFHLGGPESVSRYDFSIEVARTFGYPTSLLAPVSSQYFPNLARRPGAAVCSIEKMERMLGVRPLGTRDGLAAMKQSMRDSNPLYRAGDAPGPLFKHASSGS